VSTGYSQKAVKCGEEKKQKNGGKYYIKLWELFFFSMRFALQIDSPAGN